MDVRVKPAHDECSMIRVLDPTNENKVAGATAAARPVSLAGKTVGFISNGKEGTKGYFAHLDRMLREEFGIADVVWRTKSNFSAPADKHIVDEISRWHAVVTGVGD
jgi:hypothetical protein